MVGSNRKLNELQEKVQYTFKDKSLLNKALIHRSYGNENWEFKNVNNERLELLGDAVLDLIVTEYLFTHFPESSEGELAKLKSMIVSEPVLADISFEMELGKYLMLSKGEELTGGRERESILGDAFEALLGSIYLDSDFETAKIFALRFLKYRIEHINENEDLIDYKTILQEFSQRMYKKIPIYDVLKEVGPDHKKVFEIGVRITEETIGTGIGKNKKTAEQHAAKSACEKMGVNIVEAL